MDDFISIISDEFKKINLLVKKTWKEVLFILKKYKTINKMYEPMIIKRRQEIILLKDDLKQESKKLAQLETKINSIQARNKELKNFINTLQEFLAKRN